jgi:ferric-dicitrate binding protein FerR (iron transport regulator)
MMRENYDIIAKYLSGEELTNEEGEVIKKAKAEPDSWKEMEALFKKSEMALNFSHFNTDKAWENVNRETETKHSRSRQLNGWLRYAATIAILVATSLIVWQITMPGHYITYHTENTDLSRPAYVLPDGSKVTLNHGSTLKVPRKFANNSRKVYFEGEAFFEVAPDPEHPFVVKAGNADVKVLGTSFNIRSYPNNQNVEVAVKTGRVEVAGTINKNAGNKVVLAKNQKVIVSAKKGTVTKFDRYDLNDLAWFTRRLNFESASLAEVINVLNRTYHAEIEAEAGVDTSQLITASFDRQNIGYVLDVIATTLNLNIHQQDENMFYIKSN